MRARVGAAIVVASLTLALQACGGGAPSGRVGGPDLGVPVRLADCNDWRQANVSERLGTVHELRQFAGEPVGSSQLKHGPVLSDKRAYEIFDNECEPAYASKFRLYKLYTRAAAFAGATPPSQ